MTKVGARAIHLSASSSALVTLLSLRKACDRFEKKTWFSGSALMALV